MAKELPFFKFEPAEYLTGDVSFCSFAAQGVFTNICAYYWQRNCKLTKDQILKRLNCLDEFEELINQQVLKLKGDDILIDFLLLQYNEIQTVSKINSKNGSKGGRPKKTEIKAKQNPNKTESKGIREEEIRKDNNYIYTEEKFLERWKAARLHYDKKETNITELKSFEIPVFNNIVKKYTAEEIDMAISGLFFQETYPSTRLRPSHFLDNFEQYLTCWNNKEKLFKKTNKTKNETL